MIDKTYPYKAEISVFTEPVLMLLCSRQERGRMNKSAEPDSRRALPKPIESPIAPNMGMKTNIAM